METGATAPSDPASLNLKNAPEHLWLHFDYTATGAREWLQENFQLNEIALDGLFSDDSRPHVLKRADHLLLVLRGVNLNPGSDPEDMVSLRIWCDGQRLISTRRRALLSTEDMLNTLRDQSGPKQIPELLTEWIDRIIWRMSDTVDGLEESLSDTEEQLFTAAPREMRSTLLRLRQQSISIRRYIAPQREAINRLISEPVSWLDEMTRLRLRSIADRQIRHIEDIDTVRERAGMAQEELASTVAEQMNRRAYVLTIVAAIFLPLGFFTGLLGINVGGMPGVESSDAFWLVVALCGLITALLMAVFYWKRWL